MSVGSVTAAAIPQRSGGKYVIDGAVEGIKMETKWGAILGAGIGAIAGGAIGGSRGSIGTAAVGVLGGAAVGALAGAAALFLDGAANGIGAGVANAVNKPANRDDLHTNSVIGSAVLSAAFGGIAGAKQGVAGIAGGAVVGALWGGVMGHFIAGRLD